jgi:hypothetical protein
MDKYSIYKSDLFYKVDKYSIDSSLSYDDIMDRKRIVYNNFKKDIQKASKSLDYDEYMEVFKLYKDLYNLDSYYESPITVINTNRCDSFRRRIGNEYVGVYTTQDQGCWTSIHSVVGIVDGKIYTVGEEIDRFEDECVYFGKELAEKIYIECLEIRNKNTTR